MPRRKRFRAAILGYGRNGSTMHADALDQSKDFEIVAVCDIDPDRRKQAADRHGCEVYSDYRAMLREVDLDLISIVTRSDQHCTMAVDCLGAGVATLVTKPWCVNEHEAVRMVEAAQLASRPMFCWLPARWGSDFRRLRQLLDDGAIGEVFLIRRAVQNFATRSDWQTRRKYGGGYLLNWGAHVIDPPVQLAGGLEKVRSAFGRMLQRVNPGDAEDNLLTVLTMTDGTLVQAEFSTAVEPLPNWYLQGTGGTIVVRGSELTIFRQQMPRPDDPTKYQTMKASAAKVTRQTLKGPTYGDSNELYREVADALAGKGRYPVTDRDAVALPRLFDAIRTSAEADCVVPLRPPSEEWS